MIAKLFKLQNECFHFAEKSGHFVNRVMLSGNAMGSSPEEPSSRRISKDHTSPSSGYHSGQHSATPPRHSHHHGKPPAPPAPTGGGARSSPATAASASTSQTLSDLKKQRSMSRVKHPSPQLPGGEQLSRSRDQYELKKHHHHRQSSAAAAANAIEEDRKFAATNSEMVGSPLNNKKKGCCKIM